MIYVFSIGQRRRLVSSALCLLFICQDSLRGSSQAVQLVVLARKYVVGDRWLHTPRNVSACLVGEVRKVREAVEVIENKDLLLSRISSMVMFDRTALFQLSSPRTNFSMVMLFESFMFVLLSFFDWQ